MPEVKKPFDGSPADDRLAAANLLPLVYSELRKLAAARMAAESANHTLDPTALVHEAYLRLAGPNETKKWDNQGHFFAAASEAMRRILIESARRRQSAKRGGSSHRAALDLDKLLASSIDLDRWIDLDEVLTHFEAVDSKAAELAKLRIFGGITVDKAGEVLGIPRATAFRLWTYAQAWLTAALKEKPKDSVDK
jgi:RNA polymerase sigma factor (TIGR02999 family)